MEVFATYVRLRRYHINPHAQFFMTPERSTQKLLVFLSRKSLRATYVALSEFLRFVGFETGDGINYYIIEDIPKLAMEHVIFPTTVNTFRTNELVEEETLRLCVKSWKNRRCFRVIGVFAPADWGDLLLRMGFSIDAEEGVFKRHFNGHEVVVDIVSPYLSLKIEDKVPSYYFRAQPILV